MLALTTTIMTMSPATSTPSIRIYDSTSLHRYPIPHRPSFPSSGAMAIPHAREDVPPPLPPPRYIEQEGPDLGWQWGNTNNNTQSFGSVMKGSSLRGGSISFPADHKPDSLDDISSDDESLPNHRRQSRPNLEDYRSVIIIHHGVFLFQITAFYGLWWLQVIAHQMLGTTLLNNEHR